MVAGMGLYLVFLGSVFLAVLAVVAVVKIIQISDDLRYLRSRTDLSVQRPKGWKYTVGVAFCVAAGLTIFLYVALATILPHR